MSLSDLAAIGSFVSGIAVLASLIFLYFQIRQVNRQVRQAEINQRAFMNQGFTTRTIEILRFASEKENVGTLVRAFSGQTDFSADELRFLENHLRMVLLNYQDLVLQHAQGLADQVMLDYQLAAVKRVLSFPALRAQWRLVRPTLPARLIVSIEKFIAETPLAEPIDQLARYRAALSELMRPSTSPVTS